MIALLSWFGVYLEIYRYRHLVLSELGSVVWPAEIVGAQPGTFLRSVVICSLVAPMLLIALWAWIRIRTPAGAVPPLFFWTPAFLRASGLALILLAVVNQIVRRPPIVVDLTLRTGNGGFVIIGLVLAMIGAFLGQSKRA